MTSEVAVKATASRAYGSAANAAASARPSAAQIGQHESKVASN